MDNIFIFIALLVGLALGWIIRKFYVEKDMISKDDFQKLSRDNDIAQVQYKTLETNNIELKSKINQTELQKEELRDKIQSTDTEFARILAENKSFKTNLEEINIKLKETEEQVKKQYLKIIETEGRRTEIEEKNKNLLDKLETQKQQIEDIGLKFSNEFKVLANSILEEKSQKFTQQNKENIDILLAPLGKNIDEFKRKVEETYDKESKQRFSLEEKIKELVVLNQKISQEANNLTNALKGSAKKQGNWGEMILAKILEDSGLEKGRNFFVQEFLRDATDKTITNDEGRKMQPDVIVKYPDGRDIIIDSKVSLVNYEKYVSAETKDEQDAELKLHIMSLRKHIDDLSSKKYTEYNINSLDFLMLFVPIEPAYLVAIKEDSTLWEYAYKKKVLLISPTNLIAALRLVADLWVRDAQTKNAIEIAERGGKLYDKFVGFVENLQDIGNNIDKSQKSYDLAMKQLNGGSGHLLSQVEMLKKLGAKAQKSLPDNLIELTE
jgi:DNA recombination protein RmuC